MGPIRATPPRQFGFIRSPSPDRWADGSAAWDLLYGSIADEEPELVRRVSVCLSDPERLNLGYKLEASCAYAVAADGLVMARLAKLAASPDDADVDREARAILDGVAASREIVTLDLVDERRGSRVAPCDIGAGVVRLCKRHPGGLHPETRLSPVVEAA